MVMKRLIVNADDFGLTNGINQAVLKGFKEGILTSATLMVNTPAFHEAVSIARDNPGLGVGIHLNILRGKPILPSERVPTLVDRNGFFLKNVSLIGSKWILGRTNPQEVKEEFSAQIERALEAGVEVSHLDSERHLHNIFIGPAIDAGRRFGIRKMRLSGENIFLVPSTFLKRQFLKVCLLSVIASINKSILRKNSVSHPDHFFGSGSSGEMTISRFERIISKLPEGTSEIMCHPGYVASEIETLKDEFGTFDLFPLRDNELKALLSPRIRESIKRAGIELISYRDL